MAVIVAAAEAEAAEEATGKKEMEKENTMMTLMSNPANAQENS